MRLMWKLSSWEFSSFTKVISKHSWKVHTNRSKKSVSLPFSNLTSRVHHYSINGVFVSTVFKPIQEDTLKQTDKLKKLHEMGLYHIHKFFAVLLFL